MAEESRADSVHAAFPSRSPTTDEERRDIVAGLGVDIVEIDRMRDALKRRPKMRERLFSEAERAYCDDRNRPEIHYAMRFAAKEAVLKALGTGFSGMRFTDVEVMRDDRGRPMPILHGRAAEIAEERRVVEMHLSLSFTHATAVASAVAITEAARPKPAEQAPDPKAELAASFKAARAMLEEMGRSSEGDVPDEGMDALEEGSVRTAGSSEDSEVPER